MAWRGSTGSEQACVVGEPIQEEPALGGSEVALLAGAHSRGRGGEE